MLVINIIIIIKRGIRTVPYLDQGYPPFLESQRLLTELSSALARPRQWSPVDSVKVQHAISASSLPFPDSAGGAGLMVRIVNSLLPQLYNEQASAWRYGL